MAEIGLIASIIGVAGAAAKLAIGFYDIADQIGSAAEDAKMIAADLGALSAVLQTVRKYLLACRSNHGCIVFSGSRRQACALIALHGPICHSSPQSTLQRPLRSFRGAE